ncbi:ATP-binding cassette subfamily A (ABC1) member 4 [Fasciolopsis buskii]|uniref:ATP-binding cassette subfamily A (ABC1) member 4 n=1 Tax=Fasciolopsis buskii TaxID=27845 RepID=A0A8E0S390_9TREM|nr:ATP-binding cassette subfamily A (ABC1) member 4 [Fasciolopsis buski]
MDLVHTENSHPPNGFGSYSASQPIWSSTVIPKPRVRRQWRLCRYVRIYRILLWKNWLIRRRSPVLLIAELLFPLLFVLILAAFRLHTPVYNEPACHVQSQSMPSMGLLHYVQSMLCNFNYTCHEEDPLPLTLLQPESSLFYLVRNITALMEDEEVHRL